MASAINNDTAKQSGVWALTFADVKAHAIRSVANYLWRAQTIYDVHAPLAFRYLGEVIEDERHFYAYDQLQQLREQYANDLEVIVLEDHGAGSRARAAKRKKVREIAQASGTPQRFGEYLHKTLLFNESKRVLELGTNLGIGTCYLAAALPVDGHLISIDADPQVLAKAKTAVVQYAPDASVELLSGTFDEHLSGALDKLGQVDLAFIDGHHAEEATKKYYTAIRERCVEQSIVILDDVHWSPGMERAWRWVQAQPEVTLTIDLQRWGIVFFDTTIRSPQRLTICPKQWKPWHMGFFSSRTKF